MILAIIVLIFTSIYEFVQEDIYKAPSREAQVNEYLALDRWLNANGQPVRIQNYGDLETISSASEGTIFIQSDLFDWSDPAAANLESWIENGGSLILSLTFYYRTWTANDELGAFLLRFGIESAETDSNYRYIASVPTFSSNINFKEPEEGCILILKDGGDAIRLVQLEHGKGTLTVTGHARFMNSRNLRREPNARLSWYLLSGNKDQQAFQLTPGVLFIRGYARPAGLMGRIFQHGNFIIIIIPAVLLIIAGLWSVIPVFGVIRGNEELPGKTLNERFLAEGRFFKRHKSLDFYKEAYIREIKRKSVRRNKNEDECAGEMAAAIYNRNFLESVTILKNTLEKL